jgi:hypothetical protein
MALVNAAIDDRIKTVLGESTVQDLTRHLTAVDCQTCGRPIGRDQAALEAYAMGPKHAMAAVHHRTCRSSGWVDTGPIRLGSGQNLSYRTFTFEMPFREGDVSTWRPTVLLHPSVELALLDRDESGVWRIATRASWTSLGLEQVGRIVMDRPVSVAVATLGPNSVTLTTGPVGDYVARVRPETAQAIDRVGGLLLWVSTGFDPNDMQNQEKLRNVLAAREAVGGWIALRGRGKPNLRAMRA